jgi:flagellar assembly protein FliH
VAKRKKGLSSVIKSRAVVAGNSLVLGPGAYAGHGPAIIGDLASRGSVAWQTGGADAQRQSESMVGEATARADEIRRQAREAGRQEGFNEGRQAGLASGAEIVEQEVSRVRAIAEDAARSRLAILEASEGELVTLALEVARTILGQEIQQNPETVRVVVERAMAHAKGSGVMRVHVCPADEPLVRKHWPSGQADAQGRTWDIVGDEKVPAGGCLIEMPGGQVDARMETQLSRIREAFVQFAEPQKAEDS